MTTQTHSIAASDGVQLSLAVTAPEDRPKAIVHLVHGMSEHKNRYLPVMEFLASRGYACVISDLRGHGATLADYNDRGHFGKRGYKGIIDDLVQISAWAKERFPDIPLYLFGHSMGSMLVRAYCKEHDDELAGLIVCGSPSAHSFARLGQWLARIVCLFKGWRHRSTFLAGLATGNFGKKSKKKGGSAHAWLCTDPEVVAAYDADPLCGFKLTVNGYYHLFGMMADIYSRKGWSLRHPTLKVIFLAGTDDPCIVSIKKFAGAVSFFRSLGYRDVTSKLYPHMRHEILNEKDKQTVWNDLANTLDVWTNQ